MDYQKTLESLNDEWAKRRTGFGKEELSFIAGRDNLRGKLLGFLTKEYYSRKKLILHSEILYGYVFSEYRTSLEEPDIRFPTWVVFSPSWEFSENPAKLKEISENIRQIAPELLKDKQVKALDSLIKEPLSDAAYFEIPASLTGGALAYLSIVYVRLSSLSSYHLGLNLFLANRGISKELIYLPARYYPLDLYRVYSETGLLN